MSPETVKAIQTALQPVAEKIGQGAAYGWQVVVTQQYISGITSFVWAGVMLILCITAICFAKFTFKKVKYTGDYDNDGWKFLTGVLVFFSIALFLSVGGFLTDGIQHVLNPGYFALQFFIGLVHPATQ